MARERRLIRALLELADTMVVDHDILDYLYLLCERAVDVIEADAAGVLLMNRVGDLEVAAAAGHDMRDLEQFEVAHRQGPGVEAHRTGHRVDQGDLPDSVGRWPHFAAQARARGFGSVHARPLRLGDQSIGALNVFRRATGRFSQDDAAVVGGLADMASIGIAHERALTTAEQQVTALQSALDRRAVIDQAVAVLADRHGVDHGAAFEWLRRYARSNNQKLRDVAQRFLRGELGADVLATP